MDAVIEGDDLRRRRERIRERELLLALEQWGSAESDVAGDALRYVFGIVDATEGERAWLRRLVEENGLPATSRTAAEIRAEGGRANAAANAAFLAGDYEGARNLIDQARAYGALLDGEWSRLHEFIAGRAAAAEQL
ncbi:hypothetical protein ODJ79_29185 [Actinoplanes sp. KI2]|uniref:hypothetical protein n=1 Tax=Actinoplanes sp. KI2 TaxID=2983315 RepID=UPI0021D59521|nr:hypothetical protein [Actinoplanes sp. KI2]MCU7727810.1 hypothetical protein [Actinoplanes sp. KI2]